MARRPSDFRSDTVTRPTPAMREAMRDAVVGDDVFGDDPTVRGLEDAGAALLGKEASVFLPSGTMANQVAMRTHCRPGDEVLLHDACHVYRYEQGGLAALHGIQAVPLPGEGGQVSVALLQGSVRVDDPHMPRTRAVVLETSHNMAGGRVLPLDYMDTVRTFCDDAGLALHVDGARLLNAAVALDVPASRVAAVGDSVTLCLSKGIGAPMGTILAGDAAFIARARRTRKLLGGGLRQVGVVAAPALLALEGVADRLRADHVRARQLADGLTAGGGLRMEPVETNIVVGTVDEGLDVHHLLQAMKAEGVMATPFGAGRIRWTTHRDVDDEDVGRAVAAFANARARTTDRNPDAAR